jgi:hypothetical protein
LRNDYWLGSVLTTVGRSRASSANWHRAHRELFPVYGEPAGWHLSYFGGRESIRRKLGSFAHQELNNPAINSDGHIERCLASGTDLYGRAVDTTLVSDAFFPAHFVKLVNRHKEFFW